MERIETTEYEKDAFEEFCTDFDRAAVLAEDGYIFAMLTDRIEFQKTKGEKLNREPLFRKGLEIRIFHEKGEAKWFRASMDRALRFRMRLDDEQLLADPALWWDEKQYLDIDDSKTISSLKEEGYAWATGAGRYPLPLQNYKNAKIQIRNYLKEDPDTGALSVEDWRLVSLIEGEGEDAKVY